MTNQELHSRNLVVANELRKREAELLPLLMESYQRKLFRELGYTGVFDYCVRYLKLSEAQGEYYRRVAEKAEQVPQLKEAVVKGELSLSKARRIVPVLNEANAELWINHAKQMKQRELEKAVSNENPKAVIRERIRPVAKERLELRTGISEKFDQKLQRVKDLAQTSSLEGALEACLDAYLEKYDPVKKAERAAKRKPKPAVKASSGRKKLPAQVVHEVVQRDGERCVHRYPDGARCGSRRFLEKHHVREVARGGLNVAENLVTLCYAHHRARHEAAAVGVGKVWSA